MRLATLCAALAVMVSGCATYRTPGAGVNVGDLSRGDQDIAEVMKRKPVASYPTSIAIVRTQSSDYSSQSASCRVRGRFCVVTARDVETDADLERLARLPMISGIAPMGQMLFPVNLDSIKDVRLAAAQLRTDMVLVYSLDTRFIIESTAIGPLAVVSLGWLPNKKAHVTTTASAVLVDVRTGFVYGVAEATATEAQRATVWSTLAAVEKVRLSTEADAFQKLVGEFEKLWKSVVETHAVGEEASRSRRAAVGLSQ